MISGWPRADASVRVAWGSVEEAQKALGVAAMVRDLAHKDATKAEDRRRAAEADLKTLQVQQAIQLQECEEKLKAQEAVVASWDAEVKKTALEQVGERDRLVKLREEVEAAQAALFEAKKVATKECDTLSSLEARFHKAQKALFGDGPSGKAMVKTPRERPAALLPEVVAVLKDAIDGFTSLVEGEARSLSSSALTCVFSHLYL